MRFFSVTSPLNVALIGPIFSTTVAAISVGDFISRLWQPGMHRLQHLGIVQRFPHFLQGCGDALLAFDHQSHAKPPRLDRFEALA